MHTTVPLPDTTPCDQLLAIGIMLDVIRSAHERVAAGAEVYARQQRDRAGRCQKLAELLHQLEVRP